MHKKVLEDGKMMEMLVNLLHSDQLNLQAHSAMAIAYLATTGKSKNKRNENVTLTFETEDGIKVIKSLGGHNAMIGLMDSPNVGVQIAATKAVNNMADFGRKLWIVGFQYLIILFTEEMGKSLKNEGIIEPLKELIFSTPSERVEETALAALHKLDNEAWKCEYDIRHVIV
jgi:hypothetical protein